MSGYGVDGVYVVADGYPDLYSLPAIGASGETVFATFSHNDRSMHIRLAADGRARRVVSISSDAQLFLDHTTWELDFLPDGRLIQTLGAGQQSVAKLVAFREDGAVDSSFGVSGTVALPDRLSTLPGGFRINSTLVMSMSRLVVTYVGAESGTGIIVGLDATGVLDAGFGTRGTFAFEDLVDATQK